MGGKIVTQLRKKERVMDHVEKYYWIIHHPKMGHKATQSTIELPPHKVNPVNEAIESDTKLNTIYRWWVKVCVEDYDEESKEWESEHVWTLDTGGKTAEETIDNLYLLVLKEYGDY
jgi:hypothetical protein